MIDLICPSFHPSVCLPVYPSRCVSARLPLLSVFLSSLCYLSICLSVWLIMFCAFSCEIHSAHECLLNSSTGRPSSRGSVSSYGPRIAVTGQVAQVWKPGDTEPTLMPTTQLLNQTSPSAKVNVQSHHHNHAFSISFDCVSLSHTHTPTAKLGYLSGTQIQCERRHAPIHATEKARNGCRSRARSEKFLILLVLTFTN